MVQKYWARERVVLTCQKVSSGARAIARLTGQEEEPDDDADEQQQDEEDEYSVDHDDIEIGS